MLSPFVPNTPFLFRRKGASGTNGLSIKSSDSSLKVLWLPIIHSSLTKIHYHKLTKKIIGGSPTKAIAVLSFLLLPPLLSKIEKNKMRDSWKQWCKGVMIWQCVMIWKNVNKYGSSKLSRYFNAQSQH